MNHSCLSHARMACLMLAALASPNTAFAQGTHSRAELLTVAREVMESAHFCALITLDASGRPQSRTVEPFVPDSDFVVWIGTNPLTRKVGEIQRDPRVTLYYFDPSSLSYVSFLGRATLVNDAREKTKHWNDSWLSLYKDRDKGYLLISVVPERLEVVSTKRGIFGDSLTWRPPSVDLRRK